LVNPFLLRVVLVATTGGVVYFALLWQWFTYGPFFSPPDWWRHLMPSAPWGAWLTVVNVGAAFLIAIPVAFGLVLGTKRHRVVLALIMGLASALYYNVGAVIAFGVPRDAIGWAWIVAQFSATGFAVVAMVALIQRFPLTIGWSDRGSRLR
jgi:hypothetical protein